MFFSLKKSFQFLKTQFNFPFLCYLLLESQEEASWKQETKSKYFLARGRGHLLKKIHLIATVRKKLNVIASSEDGTSLVFHEHKDIGRIVVDYFDALFQQESTQTIFNIDYIFHCINNKDNLSLLASFSMNELKTAFSKCILTNLVTHVD